jgi:hypothetical protein
LKLIAINAALVLALGALALGCVELWLRLTVPASSGGSIYLYTLQTPRYKVMKANASIVASGKELRTNELGFRDRPLPPKQPGELRVIVLGDSFTVSAGVDYRDIYTTLLEQRLSPAHPGLRIVNLAVGGYNIVQYALVLREIGLALEPDLVLVALFPDNDFTLENYDLNRRVAAGLEPAVPERPWHEGMYVYRAYLHRVIRKLFGDAATVFKEAAHVGWELNVAALQDIAEVTRREKLPLLVVALPHTFHFEKQRALFARVEALCRALELTCVDLLEPFIARGVRPTSLRLHALDAHPNERYNLLVAQELAPRLGAMLRSGGIEPVKAARDDLPDQLPESERR